MGKKSDQFFGGIEAGGTKFICAVGRGPDQILAETRFATTSPQETIQRTVEFFELNQEKYGHVSRIGIASFGPVDLSVASPTYGYITSTPKPGWKNVNLVGEIQSRLNVPIVFDTDVNGAAFGEMLWGAGSGIKNLIYLTVGTGIGGGVVVQGKPIHGLVHPEVGHILIPHDRNEDPYDGFCPYHGDCLEGLAAGPAIERRWGRPGYELPIDHPAWKLEAKYLGLALANMIMAYSPEKIILGGGVMAQQHLYPMVRKSTLKFLAGYVDSPKLLKQIEEYIIPPKLGGHAGILGALALAEFLQM